MKPQTEALWLRAYRVCLRVLPSQVRSAWGEEMVDLLAYRLGAAPRGTGGIVFLRAIVDLIRNGARNDTRLRPRESGMGMGMGGNGFPEDVKHAVRGLLKAPAFSIVAVLTLGLGIGAATGTFTVVNTVLIQELPYADSDQLVVIWPEINVNKTIGLMAARDMESIAGVTGVTQWSLTLIGEGVPVDIRATVAFPQHFDVLGVRPALGRAFTEAEGMPDVGDVIVLSHDLWVRVFGADPAVIGRSIDISGANFERRTIIGVMPAGFRPIDPSTEAWVPMWGDPATDIALDDSWFVNTRIGRLSEGATLVQANQEVRPYATRVAERISSISDEDARSASVIPLRTHVADGLGSMLWVALGAVSLVLLMACVNVANLLLVRAHTRAQALAIRSALGAGRARIARLLLVESAVLGIVGGAIGVGFARLMVGVVRVTAPVDFPRIADIQIDATVLAYAVLLTCAATLLAGVFPAVRASRVDGTAALGGAARGTGGRRGFEASSLLITAEISLAVVVTLGSGLMIRSLDRLLSVDTGLDTEGVLSFRATLINTLSADPRFW